jgi:hypothetical protein
VQNAEDTAFAENSEGQAACFDFVLVGHFVYPGELLM